MFALLLSLLLAPPFTQVDRPRDWSFPRDHGRHDGFRTEWWYFTGNLDATDGRRFGYQLTFFRSQLTPAAASRPSVWATNDLYFAHAAITDASGKRFEFRERLHRGQPPIAIASADTLDVKLLDWSAVLEAGTLRLHARDGDNFAIELTADASMPPVLQGHGGLSPKGVGVGQASFYASFTRLPTRGTLRIGGEDVAVTGRSWMDHEFSSNVLGEKQVGWDWFSLQLDDGRDVMLFRLRDAAGNTDYASANLVAEGRSIAIDAGKLRFTPSRLWKSPSSGGVYPQRWELDIPGVGPLVTQTVLANQELNTNRSGNLAYYEGAIDVLDTSGKPIGRGYLEMTGYAKPLAGGF